MIHKNFMPAFTLLECVISLALGLLIISGSLHVFLSFKGIFMQQQGLSRIQENARIATQILGQAISSSGYFGCSALHQDRVVRVSPYINRDYYGLTTHERVKGISVTELKTKLPLFNLMPIDSDVLWVKSLKKPYRLNQGTLGEEGVFVLSSRPKVRQNQILAIADCSHIDFVQAAMDTQESHQSDARLFFRNPSSLSKYFAPGATVGVLKSTLYYIASTGRHNAHGRPIFALYSTDLNGRTLELIEGVEQLRLRFAVLEQNQVVYLKANEITDWSKVIKIRAKLSLNSIEAVKVMTHQGSAPDSVLKQWWEFEWPIKGLPVMF